MPQVYRTALFRLDGGNHSRNPLIHRGDTFPLRRINCRPLLQVHREQLFGVRATNPLRMSQFHKGELSRPLEINQL
jgi:hypothetical protein